MKGHPDDLGRGEFYGYLLLSVLAQLGFDAAFPRLAYRLRWPARLGRRGIVVYVVARTALFMVIRFVLETRVLPRAKRAEEERQRLRQQLSETLGREPTNDELFDHYVERLRSDAEADSTRGSR